MAHAASHSSEAQFVTLGVGREDFAAPVEAVLEILDLRPMFRVPEAPAYDRPARGQRARAGSARKAWPAVHPAGRDIPHPGAGGGGRQPFLGLAGDRVIEVLVFNASEIEPAPRHRRQWHSEYIGGIGHRDGRFAVIFDLARLFSAEEAMTLTNSDA